MAKIINKKNIIIAVAVLLAIIYFVVNNFIRSNNIKETELNVLSTKQTEEDVIGYNDFLNENIALSTVTGEYKIALNEEDLDYKNIKADEMCEFVINVEQTGLYSIKVEYITTDDSLYDYDISVMINGEYQFNELKNMPLKNSWLIDQENFNNKISPTLLKNRDKIVTSLYDRNGYYDSPLKVKLEAGENTVSIIAGQMDISICSVTFYTEENIPNYTEYKKSLSHVKGEAIYLEAEYADIRNSASIQEQTDTSSVDTTPVSYTLDTINTIGGSSFSNVGDELTWIVDVKKSGTYSFNMRVRQNYNSGSVVYRSLQIDGKTPYEECKKLEIPYKNDWQNFTFENNNEPYLFELSEGRHEITLKVTYGDSAQVINKMSVALDGLNTAYRKIIMLVSPNPDPYRNYLIEEKIPDVLENLSDIKDEIKNVSDYLSYISGSRGSETSELDNLIRQLEDFEKDPNDVPAQLSTFKSNISAMGTWISNKRSLPLEIDNIELLPEDVEITKQNSSFWKQLCFDVKRFLSSFTSDYSIATQDKREVEVWTTAGRQQVDVIQRLIDEDFSKQYDIKVNIKLVQSGALIPAVVSGIGPDVSIMEANGSAVNFAVRKAVKDLSDFEDFNDLYVQFDSEAFVPLSFNGEIYGIPEQRSFPIMFYRTDILEELNLEVPNTWDELYSMMFELQKNNMDVGIGSDINTYMMFLYQQGGSLYNESATKTELLSKEGINAFKTWTKYFSDFGLPLTYNFVNRFSSGEMPIAITDYTAYNTLVVSAPEIYDLWDIALVPGTEKENGTIERSVTSTGTCSMIFESANDQETAWKFVKWWTDSKTQQTYARNIEIKLGASARYPVANKDAFNNMMWTPKQLDVLKLQMQYVKGIPEIPGSYFTNRHITNAFRSVVYNSTDVKETLLEYSDVIDQEIKEKRKELNLD